MPRCSIVIPVFNRANLTRQCLDRLLADPATEPTQLSRPGHVVPLRSQSELWRLHRPLASTGSGQPEPGSPQQLWSSRRIFAFFWARARANSSCSSVTACSGVCNSSMTLVSVMPPTWSKALVRTLVHIGP